MAWKNIRPAHRNRVQPAQPAGEVHTARGGAALRRSAPDRTRGAGYGFTHKLDTAAAEPFNEVRALDYSPAEYRNPSVRTFPIKRTRDEIVELVPRLYLGRALLTMPDGEVRLIAYFALREFSDEREA